MALKTLGIGEMAVTDQPGDVIRVLALGSCVAVIIWDPDCRCLAVDHVALPESSVNPELTRAKPGYFADTGIPAMIAEMKRRGSNSHGRNLVVTLVGGAQVGGTDSYFEIGKRNVVSVKQVLWRFGLGAVYEEIGGTVSRTVIVEAADGKVSVKMPGRAKQVICP